jgi:hypothetical protein
MKACLWADIEKPPGRLRCFKQDKKILRSAIGCRANEHHDTFRGLSLAKGGRWYRVILHIILRASP